MTASTSIQDAPLPHMIKHIISRFHDVHRQQLSELMPLAQKVASVHADHFPQALLPLLESMEAELLQHMMKEERVLFPMITQGVGAGAAMPIRMMMHEHNEHEAALEQLKTLTHDFTPPANACGSWQRLYALAKELSEDLQAHIDLENQHLFARTLAAS